MIIQPVADGMDDRRPNTKDRPLARGTNPQVTVIHQEFNTVFLWPDGIFLGYLDNLQIFDPNFVTARMSRRAFVSPNSPREDKRGFLRQRAGYLKHLRR